MVEVEAKKPFNNPRPSFFFFFFFYSQTTEEEEDKRSVRKCCARQPPTFPVVCIHKTVPTDRPENRTKTISLIIP